MNNQSKKAIFDKNISTWQNEAAVLKLNKKEGDKNVGYLS
jgi:hypothetical protein